MIDWPKTEGKLRATMLGLQQEEADRISMACVPDRALRHSHVAE